MTPFSGFLQAFGSHVSPFEGIGGQPATRINGLAAGREAALHADDNGVSFLAWVNSLMDSAGALTAHGDSVLETQVGSPEAKTPERDQINLPINGSINHPSSGSAVLQTQENAYRDGAQNPVSQNAVSTMVAHGENGTSADQHHVPTVPAVSEMLAAKGDSAKGEGQQLRRFPDV